VISASGKVHGYAGCLSGKSVRAKEKLLKKNGIAIKNGRIDLKKHMHRF
jgi:alkylated DNA nucleotide flippase Atl1